MANLSRTTRDHEEIRRWAEERGGKPAHVKNTGSAEDIGILRIDFPGYSGEGSLEPISWEDFFKKFDERGLALVYQEETARGQKSNFNKLVSAETVEQGAGGGGRKGRSGATRSRSGGSKTSRSGSTTAARKGGAPKKAAASTSTRSSARRKSGTNAPGRKASSKNTSAARGGAKKSSSKAAAGKRSSAKKAPGKKQSGSRSAGKKSAARRRR
jgi:hypothetical protein